MSPVKYTIDFWDDWKETRIHTNGITFAPNYIEAMENICKYYGDECIISVTIEMLEECTVYEIDSQEVK